MLVALALAATSLAPAHAAAVPDSLATDDAFPVTLGSFATTLLGSRAERTENIRLAAAALDGAVLPPGATLSFNATVGPRTRERGYRDAPVILRESRQMEPGGGVCQVASTVFVAALLSGLTPVERHRHSYTVDYVPRGEDATIAWGAKDLRLANDLERPLRLRVAVVGSTLTARFEAEEPPEETFELETVERESDADDAGLAPGREIELYRLRLTNGEVTARELVLRDVYPPLIPRER